MRYAYDNLKHNCYRRKGRAWFYLTFEEFKQYAYETRYMVGKGITKTSWSIDRVDNDMGYFIGNIRPRTISSNSRKGSKQLHYDWVQEEGRMIAYVTKSEPAAQCADNPF